MKLKLDETAKKFMDFLDLVNLLEKKIIFDQTMKTAKRLIDLRLGLEKIDWDEDDENWKQMDNYRDLIDEETKSYFADNSKFCSFLFGTESIYELRPKPQKGEGAISREAVVKVFCEAIASFQNFISNYQILPNLMSYVELTRGITQLQQNIGVDNSFSTSWSGIGIVSYVLTNNSQLEISLYQSDFYYGYRDFERIFRCKWCKNYFLARRKDANFCSNNCRYSYKQKKRLEDPKKRKQHLELKKNYYRLKLKNK